MGIVHVPRNSAENDYRSGGVVARFHKLHCRSYEDVGHGIHCHYCSIMTKCWPRGSMTMKPPSVGSGVASCLMPSNSRERGFALRIAMARPLLRYDSSTPCSVEWADCSWPLKSSTRTAGSRVPGSTRFDPAGSHKVSSSWIGQGR